MSLPQWEMILRLVLAAGLGSMIGWERERLAWAAGLRTHMLVSVGACLAILVSAYGFTPTLGAHVVLDPSRVAAQVVSGVGFLGAGSIILRNDKIKGLTTAASLWAVAGVGLAAGAGLYTVAMAATAIVLVILAGLKPFEQRFQASRNALSLRLSVRRGEMSVGPLEKALGGRSAQVRQLIVRPAEDEDRDDVSLVLNRISNRDTAEVVRRLRALPFVLQVDEPEPRVDDQDDD